MICAKHQIEVQVVIDCIDKRVRYRDLISRCPTCVAEAKAKVKMECERRYGARINGKSKTLFEGLL